ncbi:hypothetical protein Q428_15030 [Fervidicella metallireducens AeB]|uniref:Internalin n=1 Tax=Fervidicella metallireducens AeB TaxID=1403537 RepID=A0A017RTD0_9CLOT|nr:hypothetical protein [Fervidicella metallireducens]EYE87140.1 hypothetical protein Q428_15030 [Fervidicella metallireducens AeB]
MIKEGFKFCRTFYEMNEYNTIFIEEKRINECINYINDNNIKSVCFSPRYYINADINFLRSCPNVDTVRIESMNIDYSGLYNLNNLKALHSDNLFTKGFRSELNLKEFSKLELLSIGNWNKNIKGLNECRSLKSLRLWKYKPESRDLQELSRLNDLEVLVLTQSVLTSLKGCGELMKLQCLQLYYIKSLERIDELERISNSLKNLRIEHCKNIKNHEYVTCLKNLVLLDFSECGEIPSINFIKEMGNLKTFTFVGTNIIDGDLSPCIGLGYVGFLDKKHYSHKFNDFKQEFDDGLQHVNNMYKWL